MKKSVVLLLGVLAILLFFQLPFFRPEKNYSTAKPVDDIYVVHEIPMDIQMDFNNACYDCHSNYTEEYPWYYNFQPVSWWMNLHIKKAKEHLNFSEFANYTREEQIDHFKKIRKVMEAKAMPLKSYLLMHEEAKLSDREYQKVADWAGQMAAELEQEGL